MVVNAMDRSSSTTIVGQSPVTKRMIDFAERIAPTDRTILLRGETGSGKDHLAAYIHSKGIAHRPFVPVDCGSLTDTLSGNELFGHVPGGYTGAQGNKTGLVTLAANGTIFFNEVANMTLEMQAMFLRILDKGTYRQVGGTTENEVTARIVAATNADLEDAVRRGRFRLDLYHRLKQIPYNVPSLRERTDDIPTLVEFFLQQEGFPTKVFSTSAMAEMQQYHWPGNVRELRNAVISAAFFSPEDEISFEHVRPHLFGADFATQSFTGVVDQSFPKFRELYDRYIREALRRARGKFSKAAVLTGMTRQTIQNKVRELDLGEFVKALREGKAE